MYVVCSVPVLSLTPASARQHSVLVHELFVDSIRRTEHVGASQLPKRNHNKAYLDINMLTIASSRLTLTFNEGELRGATDLSLASDRARTEEAIQREYTLDKPSSISSTNMVRLFGRFCISVRCKVDLSFSIF